MIRGCYMTSTCSLKLFPGLFEQHITNYTTRGMIDSWALKLPIH